MDGARNTERDSQVPCLEGAPGLMGLMGLTDAEFICAGGVNMRPDRAGAAFEEVAAQTDEIVA